MPVLDPERIRNKARELGFDLAGVAPLRATPEAGFYPEWLRRGYAGEMRYLETGLARRLDPGEVLPGARSIVVCALNYHSDAPAPTKDPERAWISRYAWGEDYHDVLGEKLDRLAEWIGRETDGQTRAYVDTGPVLERVWARYAGIGWFGKNTCIIDQGLGSWLFLGCILTDLDVGEPAMPPPDRCGTCTRCLDACPTGAFEGPYILDSRKCISYLNIELRGPIPQDLREGIGHHLFGCDICQDVCPWNRRAPFGGEGRLAPRQELVWPELDSLLDLDEAGWRQRIRGTSLERARVRGLLRNLMIVVGNSGTRRFLGKLGRFLDHPDPDVREAARWAQVRLGLIEDLPPESGSHPS
jgi:epoxyqueuosine reductase